MKQTTVIVVGGGLSGLTSASYLADAGADVTILEQGKTYTDRNIENGDETLIGLGGAGTLSGGKLCFPPASGGIWTKTQNRRREFAPFCRKTFSSLHMLRGYPGKGGDRFSGEMVRKFYHTEVVLRDDMHAFVNGLIRDAVDKGVHVRCGCRVNGLRYSPEESRVFFSNEAGEPEFQNGTHVIFAGGRVSAPLLQRVFGAGQRHQPDIGIRLTADRSQPAFSVVGEDVKLKLRLGDYLIRTFCVCCGGNSVKTSTRGLVHYDGHFERQLTELTNLGIVARSARCSGPEAAERYLRAMQKYVDSEISLKDFCKYHGLLAKGTGYEPLFEALAEFVSELYRGGMLVQNPDEIPIQLPAVDHINPLAGTDAGFESRLPRVYVTGDSSGVSRGFIQAMWAGYCTAERIIGQMTCMQRNRKAV